MAGSYKLSRETADALLEMIKQETAKAPHRGVSSLHALSESFSLVVNAGEKAGNPEAD